MANMKFNLQQEKALAVTRRHFFGNAGLGLGAIALQSLLTGDTPAEEKKGEAPSYRLPARAKSVIYLHMAGSPSQLDLFENKPELKKLHNTQCPKEYLEGKRFAFIKGVPKML